MRHQHTVPGAIIAAVIAVMLAVVIVATLAACATPQPATPLPIKEATPLIELFAAEAGTAASLHAQAPSPDTGADRAATPRLVLPKEIKVEPTSTPSVSDGMIDLASLPIGQAGHYVNMAYGYWIQYPPDWHTGFGNRPVQVLFSNLPPGSTTREEMRQQGCLIEIRPSVNVNNMSLSEMRAQLPRAFEGAQEIDIGGEPGYLMLKDEVDQPVHRQWVYVEHEGRTYLISMDYAAGSGDACIPAWEALLDSWVWFEPRMAPYRNALHGYSISMPTHWYRFGESEDGVWFGDSDPTLVADVKDAVQNGMLGRSLVHENPDGLPLREWLESQNLHIHQTDPLELDGVEAVRVIGESNVPGVEFMSGYYLASLGKVVEVVCLYPADQNWRFTPVANAILYSFSF